MSDEPTTLHAGRYLHLLDRGGWEYAHRPNVSGIVGVIAITDARELVLVEQVRPSLAQPTIEIPAGIAGDVDADEALAEAARRELLEETGFDAGRIERVAAGCVSAGVTDEIVTLFRASELVRRHDGGGVDNEAIVVHLAPLATYHDWLAGQERAGKTLDLKCYTALAFVDA